MKKEKEKKTSALYFHRQNFMNFEMENTIKMAANTEDCQSLKMQLVKYCDFLKVKNVKDDEYAFELKTESKLSEILNDKDIFALIKEGVGYTFMADRKFERVFADNTGIHVSEGFLPE